MQGELAIQRGAKLITHLFNAMLPVCGPTAFCLWLGTLLFDSYLRVSSVNFEFVIFCHFRDFRQFQNFLYFLPVLKVTSEIFLIFNFSHLQNVVVFSDFSVNYRLQFHHRDPGLLGLLTSDNLTNRETVYYGIIADGIHTHSSALSIAYRANKNGLILVTDAIAALGLEDGEHYIGQQLIKIENNRACIKGTDTLCGSISSMDECVRIFKRSTGWNIFLCGVFLFYKICVPSCIDRNVFGCFVQVVQLSMPSSQLHWIQRNVWVLTKWKEPWILEPMLILSLWMMT